MMKGKMYDFRISRYNRAVLNEKELCEEWTSISDVGKVFKGKRLTYVEYLQEEEKYLAVISEILKTLGIHKMKIMDLEDYNKSCPHYNKKMLKDFEEVLSVAKDVLRERYWCRIYAKDLSIHFGYDCYMYIHSKLDNNCVGNIVTQNGLFIESMKSPYSKRHPIKFWKTY